MPDKKNTPRFLDYRRSPLPLDVALSFALPSKESCISAGTNSGDNGYESFNGWNNGGASARELVLSKRVLVNGILETNPHRLVCRHNYCIAVSSVVDDANGREKRPPAVVKIGVPRYFVCYKPRGVVCSRRRNAGIDREDSVLISEWFAEAMRCAEKLFSDPTTATKTTTTATATREMRLSKAIETVGRLDEESEGLLLLTNDGSFSRLLCDPEFGLRKTYRVVVRGSGCRRLLANGHHRHFEECNNQRGEEEAMEKQILANSVVEMIERGNNHCQAPAKSSEYATIARNNGNKSDTTTSSTSTSKSPQHFPFERCHVLDAGKLPSQHPSDDSYHALVDLVLREGKRHAVRRIVKNAGLRVGYLSRVAVEGLEDARYNVIKPNSLVEAEEGGFLPGGRHRAVVPKGKWVGGIANNDDDCSHSYYADDDDSTNEHGSRVLLRPGNVMELRVCDVDRIFALRSGSTNASLSK
mmetsp:Transcript_20583/g.43226  ORF Transcript_20583/g.43226 Transcript_20583/m.43226 type:complete len:470 (+) Transcript_20583:234-1643(+)